MDKIRQCNIEVAEKLSKFGIKNLNITSIGNSIASGYSMLREIKPLLYYNETQKEDFKSQRINLETYHFARAEDNCDAKTYEWLLKNISLEEVNKLNWIDYNGNHLPIMKNENGDFLGMTAEMKEKYFPVNPKNNLNIKDILTPTSTTANIVVYNGGTGSVLDNLSRGGCHISTYGFEKDIHSVDAIMREISFLNEKSTPHNYTQVYLCGAPKYFLPVTNSLNNKLKHIAKKYANVSYVEPAHVNLIQKNAINKLGVDFHYDKEGYKILNLNIMNKIKEEYVINESVITLSRVFKYLNEEWFEKSNPKKASEQKEERKELFTNIIEYKIDNLTRCAS